MAAVDNLSAEDKEFLTKCEEELKHRFTEHDTEFMEVFNGEKSIPPVIKSWWVPQNHGRMNDRRGEKHSYERQGYRNYERRDNRERRDHYERRGYNDYNSGYGSREKRRRE